MWRSIVGLRLARRERFLILSVLFSAVEGFIAQEKLKNRCHMEDQTPLSLWLLQPVIMAFYVFNAEPNQTSEVTVRMVE